LGSEIRRDYRLDSQNPDKKIILGLFPKVGSAEPKIIGEQKAKQGCMEKKEIS
jgi:hypothetical protein